MRNLRAFPVNRWCFRWHAFATASDITSDEVRINRLTWQIIKCAFRIHSALGPGLLESVYFACLVHELRLAGFAIEQQVAVPIIYGGVKLKCGYRLDLLVEGTVILEIKTLEAVLPVHKTQLVTYLKLTGKPIGRC